jgi:2-keto-4-pentenoate hydratase/2-oxohepta-3-ene-1,7-dioic acid hydratase in catechol pathway
VVRGDTWLDVSAFGEDYGEVFLGSDGPARLSAWLETHAARCPAVDRNTRLGPPIMRPSKILCIGRNYRAHAEETGSEVPSEPVVFMKATTALAGPNDEVPLPRGSEKTDWEVELAVIVGKTARYVDKAHALEYVAGYALHNDYSERSYQLERGGQWVKGKSADGFAPLGPLLVTKDEIDYRNLKLWLKVNGNLKQSSTTAQMIFDVPTLVSYLSEFMTLLPGDVISTGTPDGVGLGHKPPVFLKPGDVVELGVEGLGSARQAIVGFDSRSGGA